MKLDPTSNWVYKMKLTWIIDLNVRAKTRLSLQKDFQKKRKLNISWIRQ